jgi:hypothetical protein
MMAEHKFQIGSAASHPSEPGFTIKIVAIEGEYAFCDRWKKGLWKQPKKFLLSELKSKASGRLGVFF